MSTMPLTRPWRAVSAGRFDCTADSLDSGTQRAGQARVAHRQAPTSQALAADADPLNRLRCQRPARTDQIVRT